MIVSYLIVSLLRVDTEGRLRLRKCKVLLIHYNEMSKSFAYSCNVSEYALAETKGPNNLEGPIGSELVRVTTPSSSLASKIIVAQ